MMLSFKALRLPLMVLSLAALPCLAPWHAAHAQVSFGGGAPTGGSPGQGGGGGGSAADDAEAKAAAAANAPPPALPGAVPNDPDAPAGHAALDMNPNAALFDAINRGDLTAAKDALSRGADLDSTNVLGEKPIEMSIDLSRNDITFLLLSMRNSDNTGGTQLATGTVTGGDQARPVAIRTRRGRSVEQASYNPPHAADDGGTAKPEIGFLGFNGS